MIRFKNIKEKIKDEENIILKCDGTDENDTKLKMLVKNDLNNYYFKNKTYKILQVKDNDIFIKPKNDPHLLIRISNLNKRMLVSEVLTLGLDKSISKDSKNLGILKNVLTLSPQIRKINRYLFKKKYQKISKDLISIFKIEIEISDEKVEERFVKKQNHFENNNFDIESHMYKTMFFKNNIYKTILSIYKEHEILNIIKEIYPNLKNKTSLAKTLFKDFSRILFTDHLTYSEISHRVDRKMLESMIDIIKEESNTREENIALLNILYSN